MSLPNGFNRIRRYPQRKLFISRVRDHLPPPNVPDICFLLQADGVSKIKQANTTDNIIKAEDT